MNAPIKIDWVYNLYELGTPIKRSAESIHNRSIEARERLEQAKRTYREELLLLQQEKLGLVRAVEKDWTPAEIDAAKRGFCLVDGREVKL